jgi:hypothetical protein
MSGKKQTVVFGPFIGEFGWELLYWHGAVRKLCDSTYKNHHRIAVSLDGRQPFYPLVDEFVSVTPDQLPANYSARGYITDGWRDGLPGESVRRHLLDPLNLYSSVRHGQISRASRVIRWKGPSVETFALAILDELKSKYPKETTFVHPFKINQIDSMKFGHDTSVATKLLANAGCRPSLESQDLQKLVPSDEARRIIDKIIEPDAKFVAVFPRSRPFRRTDKNWSRENYLSLANHLVQQGFTVGFLGAKGGSYFAGENTGSYLDFVNLSDCDRLNLHLAVLERSKFAIGAMSGSLLVALAAGCPAIIFGDPRQQLRYYEENYLRTPMIYIATLNPKLEDLIPVIQTMPT